MGEQYFTEFEFKKDSEIFWFPILINASDIEEAKNTRSKIEDILKRGFKIRKSYPVQLFKEPQYSEALRPHVAKKSRAEISKLSLRNLHLMELEGKNDYSFNQHIVIVPQNLVMIYAHTIQSHLENLSLLTTQFHHQLD
jgi:hypothetical protein